MGNPAPKSLASCVPSLVQRNWPCIRQHAFHLDKTESGMGLTNIHPSNTYVLTYHHFRMMRPVGNGQLWACQMDFRVQLRTILFHLHHTRSSTSSNKWTKTHTHAQTYRSGLRSPCTNKAWTSCNRRHCWTNHGTSNM